MAVRVVETASMGRSLCVCKPGGVKAGEILLTVKESHDKIGVLLDSLLVDGTFCGSCLRDRPWGATDLQLCQSCGAVYLCSGCRKQKDPLHNSVECQAHKQLFKGGSVLRSVDGGPDDTTKVRILVRILSHPARPSMKTFRAGLMNLEEHFSKETVAVQDELVSIAKQALALVGDKRAGESGTVTTWALVAARFRANEMMVSIPWRWTGAAVMNLGNLNVGVGLFTMASYCNHSCNPNAHYLFDAGPNFVLRATKSIPEGEHVYITYESLYASSAHRKPELESVYHFVCNCPRCRLEEDGGSRFGELIEGLVCPDAACGSALLTPRYESSDISGWQCGRCMQGYDLERSAHGRVMAGMYGAQMEAMELFNGQGGGGSATTSNKAKKKCAKLAWKSIQGGRPLQFQKEIESCLHPHHSLRYAMRIMKVGISHSRNDHRNVVEWARRAIKHLNAASFDGEFDRWTAELGVLATFHSGMLEETTEKGEEAWRNDTANALMKLKKFYGETNIAYTEQCLFFYYCDNENAWKKKNMAIHFNRTSPSKGSKRTRFEGERGQHGKRDGQHSKKQKRRRGRRGGEHHPHRR